MGHEILGRLRAGPGAGRGRGEGEVGRRHQRLCGLWLGRAGPGEERLFRRQGGKGRLRALHTVIVLDPVGEDEGVALAGLRIAHEGNDGLLVRRRREAPGDRAAIGAGHGDDPVAGDRKAPFKPGRALRRVGRCSRIGLHFGKAALYLQVGFLKPHRAHDEDTACGHGEGRGLRLCGIVGAQARQDHRRTAGITGRIHPGIEPVGLRHHGAAPVESGAQARQMIAGGDEEGGKYRQKRQRPQAARIAPCQPRRRQARLERAGSRNGPRQMRPPEGRTHRIVGPGGEMVGQGGGGAVGARAAAVDARQRFRAIRPAHLKQRNETGDEGEGEQGDAADAGHRRKMQPEPRPGDGEEHARNREDEDQRRPRPLPCQRQARPLDGPLQQERRGTSGFARQGLVRYRAHASSVAPENQLNTASPQGQRERCGARSRCGQMNWNHKQAI